MREIKFRAWDLEGKMMFYSMEGFVETFDVFSIGEWCNKAGYELMQYTGLKDKNGVEIYEGDIVTHYGGTRYRVITYTGVGFGSVRDDLEMDIPKFSQDIEVIGNIYEHPQLTEVK